MSDFKFNFSLEVLNHLGRGLYRNFATVIAEAVSNSWDAEATEVHITINKNKKEMSIKDNGKGMDSVDFQNKFLKVGYSRREDISNVSNRKVLGRKGIGKLAMLSISEKVTVLSRKDNCALTGGVIDNEKLDEKIKDDGGYNLENVPKELQDKFSGLGTYIGFNGIKPSINNPEIIKKYLAVMFNFSFSFENENFDIYVNDNKVSANDLFELNKNTQFLWYIGLNIKNIKNLNDRFDVEETTQKILPKHSFKANHKNHEIKGFIASVMKPGDLKIRGTGGEFSAGLHLFVNGRLRQEDIFKDISSHRVVESYVYGEIHVDGFDDGDDIFTSNREGVVKDSKEYIDFLEKLKDIQGIILKDWDEKRIEKRKEKINLFDNAKYGDLKTDKIKAIDNLIKMKKDDDFGDKINAFIDEVVPKASDRNILISHTKGDKVLADKIYEKLLNVGFESNEILYTSSSNMESKLPSGTNIYNYLRKFFVQDWRENPSVFFVVSKGMESSWLASIEAGAAWVTQTNHTIAVAHDHSPKRPLDTDHIYIQFDEKGVFTDPVQADNIFELLAKKYNKKATL